MRRDRQQPDTMKVVKLIASILLCQAAGFVGALFTSPAIPGWYATLQKPSFNPPAWLFAPAWTILYLLMGISLFLVWQKGWEKKEIKQAITIFAVQLTLNSLWSILFFGFRQPLWALAEIVTLWLFILLTILKFKKINPAAGLLLVPYLIWVSFAALLNYFIFLLNH